MLSMRDGNFTCYPNMKTTFRIGVIVLLLISLLGSFYLGVKHGRSNVEVIHSIDTVYYEKPQPFKVAAKSINVRVPILLFAERVRDSVVYEIVSDSVTLAINYETKQYSDSTYKVQISGPQIGSYSPQLDWVEVYNTTTTQTVTKRNRFAITAGVGAALTPKGIQPTIGIQAGIILWSK